MKGTTLDNGVLVGEPREGGTALVWKGFDTYSRASVNSIRQLETRLTRSPDVTCGAAREALRLASL